MASFGHVAVGLLAGRLHGGAPSAAPGTRCCSLPTLAAFAALALLPDADVTMVALGASDAGACGHRGASHSIAVAMIIGLMLAVAARRLGWPMLRTALAGTAAVSSHAVLDLLGHGGRGMPVFWPLSMQRFHSPWRILPDAPRGLELLSGPGMVNVAIELVVFLPLITYALWPNIRPVLAPAIDAARAAVPARWRPRVPKLTVVAAGPAPAPELRAPPQTVPVAVVTSVATSVPSSIPALAPLPVPPAVAAQREAHQREALQREAQSDPPLRSSG